MIKNIEFSHNFNGRVYTVLAEYTEQPAEILDIQVVDQHNLLIEDFYVDEDLIWYEVDICKNTEAEVELDMRGLTYFDLWSEGDKYYGDNE